MVRQALFGPSADRAMMNFRVREVLNLLHATELAHYVTDLDPRITYWPPHSDKLSRALAFGATVSQVAGDPVALNFRGSPPVAVGTIYQRWLVTVLDSANVQVNREIEPTSSVTSAYVITDTLSNAIPLTGSNLSVQFAQPGSDLPSWLIIALAHPTHLLPDALAGMAAAGVDKLFKPTAPYTDFQRLWNSPVLPSIYRIGAAVLALGYQLNEVLQTS